MHAFLVLGHHTERHNKVTQSERDARKCWGRCVYSECPEQLWVMNTHTNTRTHMPHTTLRAQRERHALKAIRVVTHKQADMQRMHVSCTHTCVYVSVSREKQQCSSTPPQATQEERKAASAFASRTRFSHTTKDL